jgi:hypothetical protein
MPVALRRFDQEQIFKKSPDAALRCYTKSSHTGSVICFSRWRKNHLAAERFASCKTVGNARCSGLRPASACYAYLYLLEKEEVPVPDAP